MNSKEFIKALNHIVEEKGISKDVVFEAMEQALTTAYKKNFDSKTNVRVDINRETGEIKVFSYLVVVEDYLDGEEIVDEEGNITYTEPEINPDAQILLEDAVKIVPDIKVGETIEKEVTPADFGRVAASTAKQVVTQKIREAERNSEMIPQEQVKMGSSIKAYVTKVEAQTKGPLILLSRKHYGFVKRLFESEIPELADGTIELYSVAREAGVRSKVAVYSKDEKIDPIGACIGERGSRIGAILKELNGEKVDLVLYSEDPQQFIANALSPAKNAIVNIIDEKKKEALAIFDDSNFSLAIGKKGNNVKLASRLTKYKISVKTLSQINEEGNSN